MKKYLLAILLVIPPAYAQSQILITLLLGDKLNSDKIEYGITGGMNLGRIANLDEAKTAYFFNLGFYFDFTHGEHILWHTGIIAKSNMGMDRIKPYALGMPELDSLFTHGQVSRTIQYISMPILLK